jgi:hypothetical protein
VKHNPFPNGPLDIIKKNILGFIKTQDIKGLKTYFQNLIKNKSTSIDIDVVDPSDPSNPSDSSDDGIIINFFRNYNYNKGVGISKPGANWDPINLTSITPKTEINITLKTWIDYNSMVRSS